MTFFSTKTYYGLIRYYIWGNSTFTSKNAYTHLLGHSSADPIFKWIWKSSCEPKHKVFFWLLVQDRLSTRNLFRRNMNLPSHVCVLCNLDTEETVEHLFMDCDFAKACWGLLGLTVISTPDNVQRFKSFKSQLNCSFYMEIIILLCWSIWTVRNDLIFRGIPSCCLRGLEIFKLFFKQLLWRAKKKYFPAIELWLEQVV